jgi:membrane protein implicated in regulation of membrane protease activity
MPIYGILPLAGLLGAAVSFLIYRFVVVPLSKAQNTSAVEIQSLVGHKAKVTEKIFQGGFGQITYHVNGNTYNSPARSENGGEIARGAGVEIIYIQDNTYFVREK